jgi:replicative DNA helicase
MSKTTARKARTDASHADREQVSALFDKVPPQDIDAERSVLGSILLSNDALDDVLELLH